MSYNAERRLLAFLLSLVPLLALPAAQADDTPAASPLGDPGAIRVLLAADLETTLSSQMNGTLGELKASLGQQVAKNALLAQLNCEEAQARAKVAVAELTMAKQNLDAKRNLRKLDAVGDLEVAMASTEVQKAEGARALAQAQSGYCQVQAPFAGRVAKVHVKPYQTVAAGTPLFDLVSDGALKVRLNVPSSLLPRLKPGLPLEVSILETGKSYGAHISAINSRVDAVAQTVELEARLDAEHPELIAGMSGTAHFPQAND
ncbi:efflux RND transporter periplasmic adaptor subunit [Metapseudomonas lalkuanensis]|uniref:efflux RND transporter periplasmic adaptor subunit n=1 Tax=Metapseudomonas lalkuanensis TaxID=2604832 RepID=UPI001CF3A3D8|nr:efflux RND transporter periplasmic adaptor subunit [Pseudomonas lalkuanensis]UCO95876.1 efflux RND transporter periplasmic adaptor subunit [Pseudomonas lalkuanensis]